ncbi:BppU family phage baseplate upper protein [Bacillus wiedmannii]|uniref:BppU family phage baseplate upper protein n=1 Tax=Bacillus wiedmannii TaxID=1890302 RepID=UPI003F684500
MQHKDFNVKEEELKLIRFYQNDLNSAKLLINVTHDKVVTDFSSAISVQIAFLKPDCKRVFQDVQNVNQMQGKYYVVLSTQTLIAYGNVIAQLRFTFPNSKVIETCKFAFTVDESIMSDDAMKSTNEFPVIQKAIEAGKKLEGVDIDGIIAAGELAKGAVKKSGDTMTGHLAFDAQSGEKVIRSFLGGTKYGAGFALNNRGLNLFDWSNNSNILDWESSTKTLTLANGVANTNILKKSDVYSDWILPGGTPKAVPNGVDMNNITESGVWQANGNPNLPNVNSQWFIIEVFRHTPSFVIQRATRFAGAIPEMFVRASRSGTFDAWQKVTFSNEVVLKYKDGTAILPLENGATAVGSRETFAIRAGNTVTLQLNTKRTSSSDSQVCVLPADMRPFKMLVSYLNGASGSGVCQVVVNTNGAVQFHNPNVEVSAVITFCVN